MLKGESQKHVKWKKKEKKDHLLHDANHTCPKGKAIRESK